ncbi:MULTISPECIES: NIPSNAP family protein [unclassified Diaminobutyricimonas]|uniref:NIPSNAP family protein n=1 Tax=unclassified Diaminobutyricimonas TaxID=2643261 RepID=UPI0012F4B714|nr:MULTISPECIES: NIPSNAP family protein [unclassified Diaminobutyricimonas]
MLVEERTYVLHTHVKLADYLATYENIGLPVQRKILGGFLGYFVTEFGTQNQLTHFWAYTDLEDRRRRRALLHENEQWLENLEIIRPMILSMENKIMYPTSFSPIRSLPVTVTDADTAFTTGYDDLV